jgi:hypothetical protein
LGPTGWKAQERLGCGGRANSGRVDQRRGERRTAGLGELGRRLAARVGGHGDRTLIEQPAFAQRSHRPLYRIGRERNLFRDLSKRQAAVAAPPHSGRVARKAVRSLRHLVVYDELVVDLFD